MPLTEDAQDIIARLPPVSLEELDERASLLRRLDHKYVLDADSFLALLEKLRDDHEVLEISGSRAFRYQSVYFDTPGLRCFHDHVEDRAPRFKARTRLYRDTGRCVFEVKLKNADGETDKQQIDYSIDGADELDDRAQECLESVLASADLEPLDGPLEPSLRTKFRRLTLTPRGGPERTTCDFDLELDRPGGRRARFGEGRVVVETKSEDGDSPSDRALAEMEIESISLSKYRTGIALLADGAEDPDADRPYEEWFELVTA